MRSSSLAGGSFVLSRAVQHTDFEETAVTSFVIDQFHAPDTDRRAQKAADALEHRLGGILDQGVAPRRTLLQLPEPLVAPAIRERGAHAVWRTSIGRWEGNAAAAWSFLHDSRPALDAYVTAWRSGSTPGPGRAGAQRRSGIAAYIGASAVVSAKEVDTSGAGGSGSGYEEIGWTTLLADVVRGDRAERVGGTVHARPSVAAR
jgi:hypothetical protein